MVFRSSYKKLGCSAFRHSNRLSYQAMSSTRTQSQICTAAPISSFVQCQISFRLLPSSLATFI